MRYPRIAAMVAAPGIALGLVAAAAGSAAAQPPPCPAGLTQASVGEVQDLVDPGFEDAVAAADEGGNNNGQVCYKLLPEQAPPKLLFGDDSPGFGSGNTAPTRP
jgi:hypothetical protein